MGSVRNTQKGKVLVDRGAGIYIWEGQQIPRGARIARVGMTGRTTGPHLHWGLLYNGKYIDPASVLRQMFAQQI
jgi:murein DD-endopeptidase MepM/ murein hydrolase activator NlpD